MKRHSSGFYLGIIVSLGVGFALLAGVWLGLSSITGLGHISDVYQATKTGPNSATLQLSAYPDSQVCHADAGDPQIDWVSYCTGDNRPASNIEVPPNSVITVIIKQYDTASTLINDYFSQVRGTIGGVAFLNGKPFSQVTADAPGHTFTIQSTPNSPYPILVSVPLTGVSDNAPNAVTINGNQYPNPNVISFQFHTGPAGVTYIWHCYVPCGSDRGVPYGFSGPMGTLGFMAGTITVTSY
ncbi:MAG TPA: hypothetical protein VFA41_02550 [Ktedonobacteraceae bacterium]|nr:hypothetical protein [Ktedonobacteraceae bacterium]